MFTFIIPRVPGSVHRHLDTLAVDRGLDWAGVQRDRQVETLPSAGPPHKPDDQRSEVSTTTLTALNWYRRKYEETFEGSFVRLCGILES